MNKRVKRIRDFSKTRTKPLCSIKKMGFARKKAILGCRGIVKTHVILKFNELIFYSVILTNLSSTPAAWIGYYYGVYSEEFKYKKIQKQGYILS